MQRFLRFPLLGLISITLPACGQHNSPPPPPEPLHISAAGGTTTSDTFLGTGHSGGKISMFAAGSIMVTAAAQGPSTPALPSAPSTGTELTNAMIIAGTPIAGNVRVSSTLQIAAGVNPATVTTNSGDVVISGNLIAERSTNTITNSVSISAPSG